MSQQAKRNLGAGALAILAVLFVALVFVVSLLFRGARFDLTENNLYSVSDGTHNILRSIDEPLNLYLYFSDSVSKDVPGLVTYRDYSRRVRDTLEEFASYSGGKLNVSVIDPLPFSEAEDAASAAGLSGFAANAAGDNFFFGLVGTNSVEGREQIAFFDPSKEAFLEYDLAKLIYNLNQVKRPVIGLMSSLPITRGFDPATRQMREPWIVTQQAEQLFEIRTVATTADVIDEEIDVLAVVHPKNLTDETVYAIDQFVMRGGKLALFVDPQAEMEIPPDAQTNPQAAMFADRSSDLNRLLSAWGVDYDPAQVVLDRTFGLQVSGGPGRRPVRHVGILSLTPDGMNSEDVTLAELNSINVSQAGQVALAPESSHEFTPLLTTTADSMTVPIDRVRFLPDPSGLLDGFTPSNEQYVIGARVRGAFPSAFPDGKPETPPVEGEEPAADEAEETVEHIAAAAEPTDILVVADTDILSDRLWAQTQSFLGQRLVSAFANNGDFIINVLDNLTGSSDLISIRGRATSQRPFTKVQELQRQAEARYQATEQQLEQQLQETERKLTELQAGRDDSNPLILTPEQQTEIANFQDERLRIRRELRGVQSNLRADIENLGAWLKIINIGLVPLLLTLFALFLAWRRTKRREEAYQ
ncbi:MAG: Gldg family protein [Pseudomonadota bacterium]